MLFYHVLKSFDNCLLQKAASQFCKGHETKQQIPPTLSKSLKGKNILKIGGPFSIFHLKKENLKKFLPGYFKFVPC